jgi:hypothetical protein
MTRKPRAARRKETRRAQPVLEGLEARRLLNSDSLASAGAAAASSGGVLSHHDREFSYTTPSGGHAVITVIGRGNLAGTGLDGSRALRLVYGGTNAFSKITGQVFGGDGRAALADILSSQLIGSSAQINGTGVGGTVLQAVILRQFDLVPGGNINLAAGVNTLVLDSIGTGAQLHLRALPPPPAPSTPSTTTTSLVAVTTPTGTSGAVVSSTSPSSSSSSSSTSTSTTLEAGQSVTVTTNGVSTAYVSNGLKAQTLGSVSGVFTPGENLVVALPTGQPPQTRPPGPPGIILAVNSVRGTTKSPINLLKDPFIFGYDYNSDQVVPFRLDLTTGTGKQENPDPSFTPITVKGHPLVPGLNLAWHGNQLDVLVGSGMTVYAYNATTGAPDGSFTTTEPINSIASSGTTVVLGSYVTGLLYPINLSASLAAGSAQPAGKAAPLMLPGGITPLGGLTGLPASTTIYAAVAARFDSFLPGELQLGIASVSTANVKTTPGKGTALETKLASVSQYALQNMGMPIDISMVPSPALGSVDQNLAVVASFSDGTNTVNLYPAGSPTSMKSLTLESENPLQPLVLLALSSTFRPDLSSSALIDIQGNVQSVRGHTATGMVLNDSGNLNLVKFSSLRNSTIVGQPLSHLQITHRSNNIMLTPSRAAGMRNGVAINKNLEQIGPLSQTNDHR